MNKQELIEKNTELQKKIDTKSQYVSDLEFEIRKLNSKVEELNKLNKRHKNKQEKLYEAIRTISSVEYPESTLGFGSYNEVYDHLGMAQREKDESQDKTYNFLRHLHRILGE